MSSHWFIKYTFFIGKNKKKGLDILLHQIKFQNKDPLLYILVFRLLWAEKHISLLKKIFYQALFLFPSSLFVKEIYAFITSQFYYRSPKTAHFFAEMILPLISKPEAKYTKLSEYYSVYCNHKNLLDSALLHIQVANYYNPYVYRRFNLFIRQSYILSRLHNHYDLKNYLEQELIVWKEYTINKNIFTYLIPQYFYILENKPQDNFITDTLNYLLHNQKTSHNNFLLKKRFKSTLLKVLIILLILILIFFIVK